MKTTVDISDHLAVRAKRLAAERGTTLRALIEEGLEHVVAARPADGVEFRLRDASVGGDGAPGWEAMSDDDRTDAMYSDLT